MAALAVNAVSWRSYGHSLILFFLAVFCLQSITSHYFLSLFGNIWVYAFLIESLLSVLVSHHQYTVLETFKRVRFSALKFQSCTKILKGWEWAWKWNTALRCAVLSVHSYHGTYGPKAELFFFVWIAATDGTDLYCDGTDTNWQDTPSAFIPPCLATPPALQDGKGRGQWASWGQHILTFCYQVSPLSFACDWPFAHLLFWGLYGRTWRAAFSSVAPCLEPSATAWGSRSVSCWACGDFNLLHSDARTLRGSLKTWISSPALELL